MIFHGEHFFLSELGAVIEVKLGVEAHHLKNEAQHSFFLSLHSNYLTALRSTEIKMGLHSGYAKQETTQDLVELSSVSKRNLSNRRQSEMDFQLHFWAVVLFKFHLTIQKR